MATYKFEFDPTHSQVGFVVRHMMFAKVRGQFDAWDGELILDRENPANSTVRATIQAASINTGVGDRDNHLRSPDFFDVEGHPTLEFRGHSFEKRLGGYLVHGTLAIRGTTKPVTLEVDDLGSGIDPWGNTRVGLAARTKIHRKDFGLTWNQALEAGGVLVGDEVAIEIDVQAVQAERADESAA